MGIELFDVGDGARVDDYICIGAEFWDAEVGDVEDASTAAGKEDGVVVGEELEGEDVAGIVLFLTWFWINEVCIIIPLVDDHNAMA